MPDEIEKFYYELFLDLDNRFNINISGKLINRKFKRLAENRLLQLKRKWESEAKTALLDDLIDVGEINHTVYDYRINQLTNGDK